MKLSPELATKYAQYRERFLGGTLGFYYGFPRRPDRPDPCGGDAGRRYEKDKYAPFMIIAGDPSADEGSFLHVDRFVVGADVAPGARIMTDSVIARVAALKTTPTRGAPSNRRSVNCYGDGHLVCKFPINVTVPC